jgi:hypothetical protein
VKLSLEGEHKLGEAAERGVGFSEYLGTQCELKFREIGHVCSFLCYEVVRCVKMK